MLRLAGGDRRVTVAASRRPDEIGSLARAFDVFRENLLQLRQAQKMETVGQLTGGLAHDFNNLLTPVIGNLQRVQEQLNEQPKLRRQVLQALAAAERAASITQRLLAFSRKQALHPQTVAVNELIEGMQDLLSFSVGETIRIELHLQADLWPVVIDPEQLENALMNLVLNSRDAMPDGGSLQITTAHRHLAESPDNAAGDYVELGVQDSGCGMSDEVIARVFEPFYTTKAVGVGSGLGLSMVYGFIKQSGGHIHIDSVPEQGTRIHLYLPRALDAVADYSTAATLAEKI
jgi:signal transduction histidine kinase